MTIYIQVQLHIAYDIAKKMTFWQQYSYLLNSTFFDDFSLFAYNSGNILRLSEKF